MKLVKKSDCVFEDGYIVKDDEIIMLPNKVWEQLDRLDEAWQMYEYLNEQEPYHEAPSLCGFHRITTAEDNRKWQLIDEPDTPTIDKLVEESLKKRDELKAALNVHAVNHIAMTRFAELLDFCESDKFVPMTIGLQPKVNCVSLGNPLLLKADNVLDMLMALAEDEHDFDV